jgi:hypothetical protein
LSNSNVKIAEDNSSTGSRIACRNSASQLRLLPSGIQVHNYH